MNLKQMTSVLCILGSCTLAGTASAYTNLLDSSHYMVTHDRLQDLYETNALAEDIWNRLTSEFVSHYESGALTEAAAVAQTAYDLAEKSFGPNHVNTADSLLKLGIINESLGNFSAAKENMIGSLAILEEELGPNHEDLAVVYTNLANLYFEQNLTEKSEAHHKLALKIRRYTLGDNDSATAQSLYNLAVLYDDIEAYDKAQPHYEQALKIWYSNFGPNHPYVANALNNLANLYSALGDTKSAVKMHEHSLKIRREIYGDQHAEVARSLINLGKLYVKASEYEKAKPVYIEAVKVAEHIFGPNHPQVAMLLYSLANIYHIQGRMDSQQAGAQKTSSTMVKDNNQEAYFKKAMPLYERALTILNGTIGVEHPAVVAMINEMTMLYKSIGNQARINKLLAALSEHKVIEH